MDPMSYMARQKFSSHKCALNEIEDYDIRGVDNMSDPKPISWEELVVNPVVLDMNYANQVFTKIDYTKGFTTFGVPRLQEKKVTDNLTEKYIASITDYIVNDKWSPYYEINEIMYVGLMGSHKVLLGDMPEILLRQVVGNTISIDEARDIFKAVLNNIEKTEGKIPIGQITKMLFSHIFLAPKDLYMTALLKEVLKACFSVLVFVGSPHYNMIRDYWTPPPEGINFTQATDIPDRIANETDEILIEKQAIFDVLLQTRVWADKYVTNPFPYLEEDITKIDKDRLEYYKKIFYINLKKYQGFKDKVYKQFELELLEGQTTKKKVKSLTEEF